MQSALDDLMALLDLEVIEVNLFRGRSPDENRQRVFGGQVAGQALVAATRTRYTLARQDARAGMVHVHFPRIGYVLRAQSA
jgi:acyl-CoA thioesterase-2